MPFQNTQMKIFWGKTRVRVAPLLPRLPERESSGGQTPSTTQEVAERGSSAPLGDADRFALDSMGLCWSSIAAAPRSRINLKPNPALVTPIPSRVGGSRCPAVSC